MAEIKTSNGSLYAYTHWSGFDLPAVAAEAVKKAMPRWDDEPYAVRIIVDQLIKDGRDQEGGWGLMLKPNAEDEYNSDKPSVVIDLTDRSITTTREGQATRYVFGDTVPDWDAAPETAR